MVDPTGDDSSAEFCSHRLDYPVECCPLKIDETLSILSQRTK